VSFAVAARTLKSHEVRHTRWRVPGSPMDIPAMTPVEVLETLRMPAKRYKDRFGTYVTHPASMRHRIWYRGHDYWVDEEALET
jgi:hypothetical protein